MKLVVAIFIRKGIQSCRKKNITIDMLILVMLTDIDDGVVAEENIIKYVLLTIAMHLWLLIFVLI